MRLLALDISTSTIGITVLDYTDDKTELIFLDHFKPNKKISVFEMLNEVQKHLLKIITEYNVEETAQEDILLGVGKFTNIKSLTNLAVINRSVGLFLYQQLNKLPTLLNVLSIRHAIKLTKELPSKEEIPELVAKLLNIEWNWLLDKKGRVMDENLDRSDSVAVGLAYIKLKQLNKLPTGKKKIKKRKKKKL